MMLKELGNGLVNGLVKVRRVERIGKVGGGRWGIGVWESLGVAGRSGLCGFSFFSSSFSSLFCGVALSLSLGGAFSVVVLLGCVKWLGCGFLKRFICRVCVSARLCVPGAYGVWVSG